MNAVPGFRCAECGLVRVTVQFGPHEEPAPAACPEHPGAPALTWSPGMQAAFLYFVMRRRSGASADELRAEVMASERADPGPAFVLAEKWGWELPERRRSPIDTADGGLFGKRKARV